jgi:hypothetical protein
VTTSHLISCTAFSLATKRYVYPTEIKTFGSVSARKEMISTGRIGRSWAMNYTTASRLPLHPSMGPPNTPYPPTSMHLHIQKDDSDVNNDFQHDENDPLSHSALSFVHGGLSPTYNDLTPFPSRINELSDSFLAKLQNRKQPAPHPPHPYPVLPSGRIRTLGLYFDVDALHLRYYPRGSRASRRKWSSLVSRVGIG